MCHAVRPDPSGGVYVPVTHAGCTRGSGDQPPGGAAFRRELGAVVADIPANGGLVVERPGTRPHSVPWWYRWLMAMNLRLTDAESDALRAKAEQEGRSMQEVARTAIAQYVSDRPQRLMGAIQRVRTEDRELLERLSK